MPQYDKRPIPMYSSALITVSAGQLFMSQRRRAVLQGQSPDQFSNSKTRDGKDSNNPDYDYLMVQVNNFVAKFPVSLTKNNAAQKKMLQNRMSNGNFIPLKFSGVLQPKAELLEDGSPQTMRIKVKQKDANGRQFDEEVDMPLIECAVVGAWQLSVAGTNSIVDMLLGKTQEATQEVQETETEYVYEPEPEQPEPEQPKPAKTTTPSKTKAPPTRK